MPIPKKIRIVILSEAKDLCILLAAPVLPRKNVARTLLSAS